MEDDIIKMIKSLEDAGMYEDAGYIAWIYACKQYINRNYTEALDFFSKAAKLYHNVQYSIDKNNFFKKSIELIYKRETDKAYRRLSYLISIGFYDKAYSEAAEHAGISGYHFFKVGEYDISKCFYNFAGEVLKLQDIEWYLGSNSQFICSFYNEAINYFTYANNPERVIDTYNEELSILKNHLKGNILKNRIKETEYVNSDKLCLAYLLLKEWNKAIEYGKKSYEFWLELCRNVNNILRTHHETYLELINLLIRMAYDAKRYKVDKKNYIENILNLKNKHIKVNRRYIYSISKETESDQLFKYVDHTEVIYWVIEKFILNL